MRYYNKHNERWEKLNGEQVANLCLSAAKGLAYLQIQTGDRIAIYSPNRVGCITTELGIFMMRAVSVPLYATSTPDQVQFIVEDAGVETMFVGGQFQYNNAYEVQQRGGSLRRLIIFDNEVVLAPGDTTSMYYDEFVRRGDSVSYENKANVTASQALATDLAVIIYTSGTTGKSKGVMLHHSNFIEQLYAHQLKYPFITNRDVSMCFLPLNHILEKAWSYLCLSMGCQVAVLSDPKRILEALPMVRPSMMGNVPRFWEKVYIGVQDKINRSPKPLRYVLRHAIQVGDRYFFNFVNEGKKAPLYLQLLYKLYDKTLFAKVKKAIGIQRGRFFPTAGASVSPEILRFLRRSSEYGVRDSLQMLDLLGEASYTELRRRPPKIRKLHDTLVALHHKERYPDYTFDNETAPIRRRLAMQQDRIQFFLPECSKVLYDAGKTLHNSDDRGKLVACIEVTDGAIKQAKLDCNQPVHKKPEVNAEIIAWAAQVGITYDRCADIDARSQVTETAIAMTA